MARNLRIGTGNIHTTSPETYTILAILRNDAVIYSHYIIGLWARNLSTIEKALELDLYA